MYIIIHTYIPFVHPSGIEKGGHKGYRAESFEPWAMSKDIGIAEIYPLKSSQIEKDLLLYGDPFGMTYCA